MEYVKAMEIRERMCTHNLKNRERERIGEEDIKVKARQILSCAVRKGFIIKPLSCELCGKKAELFAHHSDYSEPLLVNWLCHSCHSEIHKNKEHVCYKI